MNQLCIHFSACGGCTLQDLEEGDYRAHKHRLVVDTLARAGVTAEVAELVSVSPFTRRRATLKLSRKNGETRIGFHAVASHNIVDMRECRVLTPGITAFVQSLRIGLTPFLAEGEAFDLAVTETEAGFDLSLGWKSTPLDELARLAQRFGIARITAGGEVLVALAEPSISFTGAEVRLPPDAFIQPTRAGEAVLQARVGALLAGAKSVVDLFAGCGTFALTLARHMRVHAVEKNAAALAALADAVHNTQKLKPVTIERRDLFKCPLRPGELARFDAMLLDPPRAGAQAQIHQVAASEVDRIVYVSCDAASFARDARVLVEAGFSLGPITPIDQFLWSGHIELVASFERGTQASKRQLNKGGLK